MRANPVTASACPWPEFQHRHAPCREQWRKGRHDQAIGRQSVGAAVQRACAARTPPPRASIRRRKARRCTGGLHRMRSNWAAMASAQLPQTKAARSGCPAPRHCAPPAPPPPEPGRCPIPRRPGTFVKRGEQQAAGAGAEIEDAVDGAVVRAGGERRLDQRLRVGARDQRCRETSRSRLQNPCRPRMNAIGSRATRRATSASKRGGIDFGRGIGQRIRRHAEQVRQQQPRLQRRDFRCRPPPAPFAPDATPPPDSFLGGEAGRLVLGGQRVDELVEVALHHRGRSCTASG